jgi:hypothetical protein
LTKLGWAVLRKSIRNFKKFLLKCIIEERKREGKFIPNKGSLLDLIMYSRMGASECAIRERMGSDFKIFTLFLYFSIKN